MPQLDKDRFFNMAECYDRMAPHLVPHYDLLQNEVIHLLATPTAPKLIVDLGAGSGIFLEKILTRFPNSRAVWIDYSPDFLSVAQKRLAPVANRVQFIPSTLEDAWERQLPQSPDAICSMSAIHHLESPAKQNLYSRCFHALTPGGRFFNIDEMSTLHPDSYRNTLLRWVRHVDAATLQTPPDLLDYQKAWCARFKNWKARNISNISHPKQKGDDVHESFLDQLTWLRNIGFVEVDLVMKFHLWSTITGRKPL
jgi:tRNA (cmo5U34)-methyltransferase